MRCLCIVVGIAAGAPVGASAHASITLYTDVTDFVNAAGGAVDFENLNDGTPQTLNAGAPVDIGLVTVEHIGSDGNSFIADGTGANAIDATTHLDIFVGPEFAGIFPAESFRVTFPYAVNAVGFEIADFFSAGSSFGADVFAGDAFAFNTAAQGLAGVNGVVPPTFIGITSPTPFGFIEFSSDEGFGEAFGVDNLLFAIPAPGAAWAFAFAGLAAARRRR